MYNILYLNLKKKLFFKAKAFWRHIAFSLISMPIRIMSYHWQGPPIYKITYNWDENYSFESEKNTLLKKINDIKTYS